MSEREASHYERRPDGAALCRVCPHRCDVAPGASGRCGVRQNLRGLLYVTNYEELTRLEVEAIERVPLYRFRPGARVLSLGSIGESFPEELAAPTRPAGIPGQSRWAATHEAIDIAVQKKVDGIAYAGAEPFMWLEEWRDIAEAARAERLFNVAITNGFALEGPRAEIAALLDAVNLCILGPADTYRRRAKADREPVLETARAFRAAGIHLELTYLVLAGENDGDAALDDLAEVARSLGAPPVHVASPLHLGTAAPVKTMHRVVDGLRARLPEVHLSGVYGGALPP